MIRLTRPILLSSTAIILFGCLMPAACSRRENQIGSGEPVDRYESSTSFAPGFEGESDVLQAALSTSTNAIVNGINLRRAQDGFLPLVIIPDLVDLANERVVDMAVKGYLDHVTPGNDAIAAELGLSELGFFGQAAELVSSSQASLPDVAQQTLEAWFDDPNHRAVLLSPDFHYAGLGLMGDGTRWIVTLVLVEKRP